MQEWMFISKLNVDGKDKTDKRIYLEFVLSGIMISKTIKETL